MSKIKTKKNKELKENSFLNGAFIATLGIVGSKILGMLYVIPFYAIIGCQGGALYGYAYTIYNLFQSLSCAGIPNVAIKAPFRKEFCFNSLFFFVFVFAMLHPPISLNIIPYY